MLVHGRQLLLLLGLQAGGLLLAVVAGDDGLGSVSTQCLVLDLGEGRGGRIEVREYLGFLGLGLGRIGG